MVPYGFSLSGMFVLPYQNKKVCTPGWPQLRSGLPFGPRSQASLQKAQGPGVCKLPKPPASRALCQAKRAPRAAFPWRLANEQALPQLQPVTSLAAAFLLVLAYEVPP